MQYFRLYIFSKQLFPVFFINMNVYNIVGIRGLYSPSGKTSYRQMSLSLEAARLDVMMTISL